jgi:cytochrome c oxidase subunit II
MVRLMPSTHAKSTRRRVVTTCAIAGLALIAAGWLSGAWAAEPLPWQMGMQPPATPVKDRIDAFHNELLVIITLITVFVTGLLCYVMVRFSAKRHPVPTRTSHNTVIEVLWTIVPVLILVLIAIPSFKLMYYEDEVPNAEMTIKVTGHQWYWSYDYADQKIAFDSNIIPEKELKPGQKRLLDVDNPLVVPVNTTIRVQITGTDVIHSWFVPSFGVQEYAVVGRLNESWMRVEREGTYYGECNQICGVNHAFMPIAVKAVAKADFDKWLVQAKKNFSASRDVEPAEPQQAAASLNAPGPNAASANTVVAAAQDTAAQDAAGGPAGQAASGH